MFLGLADFLTALGLLLVFEGALYAVFSDRMKRFGEQLAGIDPSSLRRTGLVVAALGVVIVWLVRG